MCNIPQNACLCQQISDEVGLYSNKNSQFTVYNIFSRGKGIVQGGSGEGGKPKMSHRKLS